MTSASTFVLLNITMAASATTRKLLTRIIPQTLEKPSGSIIFLHGSGDTGMNAMNWVNGVLAVPQLTFPHLRILFPTAPAIPYSPMMGENSNVWFNRCQISPKAPDDITIETSAADLVQLINEEEKLGIPRNKILIGGFSMGGGMALHIGYRYLRDLAGVFAMSSFLSETSLVYKELKTNPGPTPLLYQSHGTLDDLVPYSWGQETNRVLTSLGVKGTFYSQANVHHELERENMDMWIKWVNKILPPPSS